MDYLYKYDGQEFTLEEMLNRLNEEIVNVLIAYRKQFNKTQQDIADASGIPLVEIERMENMEYRPPLEKLVKYAEGLGLELKVEDVVSDNQIRTLPLPIGCSDYREVSTRYCYVDKTLLIKDILDEAIKVSLFTRPRRFGKSLNMDMLRVFFEKTEQDTSVYFHDKKIWKCGEEYRKHQGQYPVIFLTFKDVKCGTWEEALNYLKLIFATECNRHPELFDSDKCNEFEKKYIYKVATGEASEIELTQVLLTLSRMLHKHHGKETIIMIDEYDTPIQQGHMKGYYDKAISFMRMLFSGGFKDNHHLSYGFMTGILRVAKESVFSSLNNLKVNSVLSNRYSEYFGFTPEEVRELAKYYGVPDKYEELCKWYDGYRFGRTDIFNPWSVIGYFNEDCVPGPFWVSTASNDVIGEVLEFAPDDVKEELCTLLNGQSVFTLIDTSVIYSELKNNPSLIYSFLLVAGYLTIEKSDRRYEGEYMCEVAIPNKELAYVYNKEILARLKDIIPMSTAMVIREAIYKNDVENLQKQLHKLLLQTVSYNDAASESFYHGFVLGLCAMLDNQYYVTSNRESGEGRFDIQLMPKKRDLPGVLIELKAGKQRKKEALEKLAKKALEQIELQRYDEDMKMRGVQKIFKYGVAFCGKQVEVITNTL